MKAIRRADLDEFLKAASQSETELSVEQLRSDLASESMSYRVRCELVDGVRRYGAERTDRANMVLQEFRGRLAAVVSHVYETARWNTLAEFLTTAADEYTKRHGQPTAPFDYKYLRGATLFELRTHEARRQLVRPRFCEILS